MLSHALLSLSLVAAASAQATSDHTKGLPFVAVPAGRPNFNVNRPMPAPNANPTDTADPRLIGKHFDYANLPQRADTFENERGIQVGYNRCNATEGGPDSMCQTLVFNDISDWCVWIPPTTQPVGNAEAGMVVACTKKAHGGRPIAAGSIKGVQVYNAPSYIGIKIQLDQTQFNMPADDAGGELDSGGQDGRGNAIGGLAYTTAFGGGYKQSSVWTQFIGGNTVCMKLCKNEAPDAANMCEHVYDTIGCAQNFPSADKPGVFETCDSDDHIPVGYLAAANRFDLPATSNCKPVQSTAIYTELAAATTTPTPSNSNSASVSGTGLPSGSNSGRPSGTTSGSNPSNTSGSNGGNSADSLSMGGVIAFLPLVAGLIGAYLV